MSFSIIVVEMAGLVAVLSSSASFGCKVSFDFTLLLSRLPHPVLIFEMVLGSLISSLVVALEGGNGRSFDIAKEL